MSRGLNSNHFDLVVEVHMPRLVVCVPIHNGERYLPDFLTSLRNQTYHQFFLIVFDDGSKDRSLEIVNSIFPEAHVLHGDGNYWWTRSVNECIRFAGTIGFDYLITLNVDIVLAPDYCEMMLKYASGRDDVILGSAIYNIDTKAQHDLGYKYNWFSAKAKSNLAYERDQNTPLWEVTHLNGRGLLIPQRAVAVVGLFDEANFPHYAADNVFTTTAQKKGFHLYANTKAILFSHVDETGLVRYASERTLRAFIRYLTKIDSPGNLRVRWKAAIRMVPRSAIVPFIIFDTVKTVARYFKAALLHGELKS
jgi:GT2 family glycosyltransferase